MKRKEIFKNIDQLFETINLYGYTLDLNYKMSVGNGACDNIYYKDKQLHIGVKELKGLFNKDYSDELVFLLFKNIFHELQHLNQQREYFSKNNLIKDDEFKAQMFFNHLACIGAYYGYYSIETNYGHYFE